MLWIYVVIILILLPTLVFCCSGSTCSECASFSCEWCESTKQCISKLSLWNTCPDTWIRDSDDCWLLDVQPNCTEYGIGCTDVDAFNYDLRATVDDGTCVFQEGVSPVDPSECSTECICDGGGLVREYGKFCAFGYYGCPAEQPCDALDLCCQIHDWCVGVESFTDCECGSMLHNCIEALTDEDYAASSCPYMKQTATMIKEETAAQLLVECLNQDFDPKCGPEINCNNVGTCQFNGGCDCNANFGQQFQLDPFGRSSCKCQDDWYPLCGDDSASLCLNYCEAATTCNSQGVCDSNGYCQCMVPYTGENCDQVLSTYSSVYYYVSRSTLQTAGMAVGICVAGIACIAAVVTGIGLIVVMVRRKTRNGQYQAVPINA